MAELKTLARPYARAAFEYADEQGKLAEWDQALADLAGVCSEPRVAERLNDPAWSAEQRAELVCELLGDGLPNGMVNFVHSMSGQKRLGLAADVASLFRDMKAQREQTVDVVVQSAYELSDAQKTQLETTLKKTLERQVDLTCEVDSNLIGGVFINANDTVIDASVRGRLAKLAESLNS